MAWGNNYYGQCNVPQPNEDFVAISAGWWHSVALKSDGTVVAWGANTHGECNVPEIDAKIVAISAGGHHTLALTEIDQPPVIVCRIDIKPGSDRNTIKLRPGRGVIPVAVLTDGEFDALSIDHETVRFGPEEAVETHANHHGMIRHEEDVDVDGDLDLVFHFRLNETGLQCGDTEATLTGETFDGQPIIGTDAIKTICDKDNKPSASSGSRISPNPFNPRTTVSFRTDREQQVRIAVYDIQGGLVRELTNRSYPSGDHSVDWDGHNSVGISVPSGAYFFLLDIEGQIETLKAILLK